MKIKINNLASRMKKICSRDSSYCLENKFHIEPTIIEPVLNLLLKLS